MKVSQPPVCSERLMGHGALVALPPRITDYLVGNVFLLVADDATYEAAGRTLKAALTQATPTTTLIEYSLGAHAKAQISHVEAISAQVRNYGVTGILAVGSGSVNDVCKLAAYQCNIPYISIATAASMNGYTSANASILDGHHKSSHPAAPPRAVVADLDIIAAAPRRLTRAGVGDTLCRSTVEADSILSHFLFGTEYPRDAFNQLRAHEAKLIAHAAAFQGDAKEYAAVVEILMDALLDAGDWMNKTGSSAVASQGEHMIAHTLEMLYGSEITAMHGELIAVTSITMHHLQQKMLLGIPQLRHLPRELEMFERTFGKKDGAHFAELYQQKLVPPESLEEANQNLTREWPMLRAALSAVMLSGTTLERALLLAGLNCTPQDLQIGDERYEAALSHAYLTRDRFTFLDLAVMSGKRA